MMDISEMTAWERLEHTRDVLNEILECTSKGLPVSDTEKELIHQELIVAVGTIVTFSESLADGTTHQR